MKKTEIAVIGGGAAGMMAAITAAEHGAAVTVYERNDRMGKKILATGNGKCNLGNKLLNKDMYHSDQMELAADCLARFGTEQTIAFFENHGLLVREKNGYLYPYGEQASAVLDVLRYAVERADVKVHCEAKVNALNQRKDGKYEVICAGKEAASFDRVILACGSKAAPKTGSDGSGYQLAKQQGLVVTQVYPALVQLKCKEDYCKAIGGVRAEAVVKILVNGKELLTESGEVQFTESGISGIPVFQLSGSVNRMLQKGMTPEAIIDFFPGISKAQWMEQCRRRMELFAAEKAMTVDAFFTGIVNKKLMTVMVKNAGLKGNAFLREVSARQLKNVFEQCKAFTLHIIGSNSYDNAQVCTGGVSMKQLTKDLEAKNRKGLYLAGEILDVDGRCGGYNLQWAWTSGYLAGKAAAGGEKRVKQ